MFVVQQAGIHPLRFRLTVLSACFRYLMLFTNLHFSHNYGIITCNAYIQYTIYKL